MALTKIGKSGITGVTNSSDASALFIDSSERVGVGATPNATFGSHLYVQATPAVNKPIISAYSTGNSNKAGIGILNDAGNRGIWTDSNDFLLTTSYEGNSTVHMKIDTNGIITILSEGRAVTTNVQQGLGKQWVRLSGAGMAIVDSFNTTSSTDSAQGKAAIAIANDMANTSYACIFGGEDKQDGGGIFVSNIDQAVAQATTGYGMMNKKQTSGSMTLEDANQNMSCLVCGDLA